MFTNFIDYVMSIFKPFLEFFSFLPSSFSTLFLAAISFLVFMGCKRSVHQ